MAAKKPTKELSDQWRKDSSNWVCGLFYHNKADARLLPPKRLAAMGWTVNFANLNSVLLFAGIVALAALIFFTAT